MDVNPLFSMNMNSITENYKRDEEIEIEAERTNLDSLLDFDITGNYKFVHCRNCNGPLIGHIPTKC